MNLDISETIKDREMTKMWLSRKLSKIRYKLRNYRRQRIGISDLKIEKWDLRFTFRSLVTAQVCYANMPSSDPKKKLPVTL